MLAFSDDSAGDDANGLVVDAPGETKMRVVPTFGTATEVVQLECAAVGARAAAADSRHATSAPNATLLLPPLLLLLL
jgi:hypothetical protein